MLGQYNINLHQNFKKKKDGVTETDLQWSFMAAPQNTLSQSEFGLTLYLLSKNAGSKGSLFKLIIHINQDKLPSNNGFCEEYKNNVNKMGSILWSWSDSWSDKTLN